MLSTLKRCPLCMHACEKKATLYASLVCGCMYELDTKIVLVYVDVLRCQGRDQLSLLKPTVVFWIRLELKVL